jgi:hypothetical protein
MGFDCTLHVIDEDLIRNEFVPRLLYTKDCTSPFDSRPDSTEIWERVRDALNKKLIDGKTCSPKMAAKMVSQFAVVYCASVLPYHYERGFCLSSLYDYFDKVSKKYRGNTEELFDELIAVHPELKGKFPQEIEENYCTGIYIPAWNVPKLLKFLKPHHNTFGELWLILKYAEQNGFAYWEATDLPLEKRTIRRLNKGSHNCLH